jgi:hypothetical protein
LGEVLLVGDRREEGEVDVHCAAAKAALKASFLGRKIRDRAVKKSIIGHHHE